MTAPESGESLADCEARLTALLEAFDRRQAERERQRAEWEQRRAEWERQREQRRAEREQQHPEMTLRIEALRQESAERFRPHREELLAFKNRAARQHESIQTILTPLIRPSNPPSLP